MSRHVRNIENMRYNSACSTQHMIVVVLITSQPQSSRLGPEGTGSVAMVCVARYSTAKQICVVVLDREQ